MRIRGACCEAGLSLGCSQSQSLLITCTSVEISDEILGL